MKFANEAVAAAFKGSDMKDEPTFERIVVVFAGDSMQRNATTGIMQNQNWGPRTFDFEYDASDGTKKKVHARNVIWLGETNLLGSWAHEFGHSLPSKNEAPKGISDRYNYAGNLARQLGEIGPWGLMGSGSHWGTNDGDVPTQMCGFTKVDGGWLTYRQIKTNETYTEKSLESKAAGDSVLQLDDPENTDAKFYYIIEARDSGAEWGAPESGVVVYKVEYDSANSHYVMNNLKPQLGNQTATSAASREHDYDRPTLYSTLGNGSYYISVPGEFEVVLKSETASPYTATVEVQDFRILDRIGAILFAKGGPAVAVPDGGGVTENTWHTDYPDIDLHAYDSSGNHVGLNYQTGAYENSIPGAIASGDLMNGEEWIFVPTGTDVRYEVSAEKTKRFLDKYPEYAQYARPKEASVQYVKYDSSGNRQAADGGSITVSPTSATQLRQPTDGSLSYSDRENPGFGNNSSCCCAPGLIALVIAGFVISRKNED
jgi:M6 family metalloprotease-like protein